MTVLGRPGRAAALMCASLAVIAACGAGVGAGVGVGQDGELATADPSPLPTLPPLEERYPDRYDDDGCPNELPDCLSTAADADASAAQPDAGPAAERALQGFNGTHWLVDPTGEVRVLTETVTAPPESTWHAVGLVRNETGDEIDQVRVRAVLLDADGQVIEVVEGPPAIPVALRAGEPAPFTLTGDALAAEVASVRWDTRWKPAAGSSTARRALSAAVAWVRPAGEEPALETFSYTDPPGERPHVVFGTVDNVGSAADGVSAAFAWLVDGRVVRAEVVDASCITGGLPEAGSCDLLVTAADPSGVLADAAMSVWTWTR